MLRNKKKKKKKRKVRNPVGEGLALRHGRGSGPHGGSSRQQTKQDRKKSKVRLKKGEYDA